MDFYQLFTNFYVPLCLFGERYLENKEDAADVVQDVFIKLWQQQDHFESLPQIKSFLYTSVRNASLNILKHRTAAELYSRRLLEKQQNSFFRDYVVEEETFRILIQAINKLTEQPRKVMFLALSGKDNKEIAEELSIAEGTVHSHKKLAYKKLRQELKDYFYLIIPFIS